MCDPILVTLWKMQPHYGHSSRENVTPSSGTSPFACYKEVPHPSPPQMTTTRNVLFWILFLSFEEDTNKRSLSF